MQRKNGEVKLSEIEPVFVFIDSCDDDEVSGPPLAPLTCGFPWDSQEAEVEW